MSDLDNNSIDKLVSMFISLQDNLDYLKAFGFLENSMINLTIKDQIEGKLTHLQDLITKLDDVVESNLIFKQKISVSDYKTEKKDEFESSKQILQIPDDVIDFLNTPELEDNLSLFRFKHDILKDYMYDKKFEEINKVLYDTDTKFSLNKLIMNSYYNLNTENLNEDEIQEILTDMLGYQIYSNEDKGVNKLKNLLNIKDFNDSQLKEIINNLKQFIKSSLSDNLDKVMDKGIKKDKRRPIVRLMTPILKDLRTEIDILLKYILFYIKLDEFYNGKNNIKFKFLTSLERNKYIKRI